VHQGQCLALFPPARQSVSEQDASGLRAARAAERSQCSGALPSRSRAFACNNGPSFGD